MTDDVFVDLLVDPVHPDAPAGQWWPPRVLEPGWIARHTDDIDVLHLHFGMESREPGDVAAALADARAAGIPVVYTVHDLHNPQLTDQLEHRRALDLLVPAADTVLTLTDAAASEIARRWHRTAIVVPHPTLLDDDVVPPRSPGNARPVIGVHLRDLRPNIDALAVVSQLADAADALDVDVAVHLNDRVRDEPLAGRVARIAAASDRLVLRRTPRLTDAELMADLAGLDVCVLPYRDGTHSGWVELCWDLAVPVVGPSTGCFGAQHPSQYHAADTAGMTAAVRAALMTGVPAGSDARAETVAARRIERVAERQRVRDAHTRVYRDLHVRRVAA